MTSTLPSAIALSSTLKSTLRSAVSAQRLVWAQGVSHRTLTFSQRVGDALSSGQQSVAGAARDVRDQASSAVSAAAGALSDGGQAAGQMGSNLIAALADSPVMLGALGLAAGALLGALVPQSDQEEAALGGIARQARETAATLANQGLEGGRHVTQAVVDKAQESAQGHGLAGGKTPGQLVDAALGGDLAGNAAEVAKDVLRTGEEAVRKEASQMSSQSGASPSHSPASGA